MVAVHFFSDRATFPRQGKVLSPSKNLELALRQFFNFFLSLFLNMEEDNLFCAAAVVYGYGEGFIISISPRLHAVLRSEHQQMFGSTIKPTSLKKVDRRAGA